MKISNIKRLSNLVSAFKMTLPSSSPSSSPSFSVVSESLSPSAAVSAASPIVESPSILSTPQMASETLSFFSNTTSKSQGRQLYHSLGNPKTIVAPMVDQSELAWRILSRKYGAHLCYTPMFHARMFATNEQYRNDQFGALDGDDKVDRPLIVQFCANDPDELLAAAKFVVGRCDAVDLNLGCPQGIARRGKYGAFLMEDWDLIYRLINKLHTELEIPVTAKLRIYDSKEKTLAYAKHILDAGAQFITVHGRTRDMKGQRNGIADWSMIRYLRENLPSDTVMFSNGNILYQEDIPRCLRETTVDAVMSAEGNLHNPAVFNTFDINDDGSSDALVSERFPRVDRVLREYFEIAKSTPGAASQVSIKSHFFKLLHAFFRQHTDLRNRLGPLKKGDYQGLEEIVQEVEQRVKQIYEQGELQDIVVEGELESWGGRYKEVPYWRCQPYFRTVNGVQSNGKRVKGEISEVNEENTSKKSKNEEELGSHDRPQL